MEAPINPRVVHAQFRFAIRESNPHLKFYMNPDDINTWYVMISGVQGPNDEFLGGEYIVELKLLPGFPGKPPDFYFFTPQGIFKPKERVCVDIGVYHADNYRGTLGVVGFCNNLVSAMIGWRELTNGINLQKTDETTKIKMARASEGYNMEHHADIRKKILSHYAEYSKAWKK